MKQSHARPPRLEGFTLLEILISLLIFAVGVLGMLGLQAVSMANNVQSKYRTDASFLANQIVGQMWSDKSHLAQYADTGSSAYAARTSWDEQIQSTLPGGTGSVTIANDMVTVTVTWQAPGASQHQFVEVAHINY